MEADPHKASARTDRPRFAREVSRQRQLLAVQEEKNWRFEDAISQSSRNELDTLVVYRFGEINHKAEPWNRARLLSRKERRIFRSEEYELSFMTRNTGSSIWALSPSPRR